MRTFSFMPLVNPGPEHHLVNLSIAGFNLLRIKAVDYLPAVHAHHDRVQAFPPRHSRGTAETTPGDKRESRDEGRNRWGAGRRDGARG